MPAVSSPHCKNPGYSGRISVYELLEMRRETADALGRGGLSQAAKSLFISCLLSTGHDLAPYIKLQCYALQYIRRSSLIPPDYPVSKV